MEIVHAARVMKTKFFIKFTTQNLFLCHVYKKLTDITHLVSEAADDPGNGPGSHSSVGL